MDYYRFAAILDDFRGQSNGGMCRGNGFDLPVIRYRSMLCVLDGTK